MRLPKLHFCLILSVAFLSRPAQASETPELSDLVSSHPQQESIASRLLRITEPLVGAPYRLSALGEGEGLDPDPRIRFDAFDCTTFVETALALAFSENLSDSEEILNRLRYREGRPSFLSRRHFPEAEWIPELIRLGVFVDITRQLAGHDVVLESKRLDSRIWARRRYPRTLELPANRIPSGTFRLPVWPLTKARADYRRIPPGTVISVVRADVATIPVRVSHQALVLEKDGELFVRHADDKTFHAVVDEKLEDFLARMARPSNWPVTGIHLLQISRAGFLATRSSPR